MNSGDGASGVTGRGSDSWGVSVSCYLRSKSNTRIRQRALTPNIQGKNRVRESRQHGTVRGVLGNLLGNWHPYRDQPAFRRPPRGCCFSTVMPSPFDNDPVITLAAAVMPA
jgi:hypothetical protein